MRSSALGGIAIALLGACSSRTPSERERALERIPAQAQVIAAADGPALASAAFRAALEAARSYVPASLACVLDVATTSEAVAVGAHPERGATVVIVTRAVVANCPALSRIADRTWTATVGAGALAESREQSMLAEPRWARARPYLVREPLAIAAELPTHRMVAVAQPEPVDAWLAIDAIDGAALEQQVKAMLERWRKPGTIELASKLSVQRTGTQVSVQADQLSQGDLVTIVADTLAATEPRPNVRTSVFTCPLPPTGIVRCHDGTFIQLSSIAALLRELAEVPATPVVAGGNIVGIRLGQDAPRLLRKNDVILGLDSHRITDARQLAGLAGAVRERAALAVRRDGEDVVLSLSE